MENKQTFQAGTQEVGGQIQKQQQDQARTNEFKAHYPSFYTHPHMHIHIPYSYDIDLIAHTRKAMSQHTITKVCFQFLPFSPFSVNLNVHDVTGSAHYTRPVQFPSNWTLITGCFPSTILLFPSAFYFIKSPSTLLTKAIAFLSLGSDKIPSVSYGTDN